MYIFDNKNDPKTAKREKKIIEDRDTNEIRNYNDKE